MELHIVNCNARYGKTTFDEPTQFGYIHIGAAISPRTLPLTLLPPGPKKAKLLGRLKELAQQLEQLSKVETATVFEAVAMPPLDRLPYIRDQRDSIHLAEFDVAILVETRSPEALDAVQNTSVYQRLVEVVQGKATHLHIMAGRNAKRLADVDKTRDGLFIFNYFVAADPDVMIELFDYMTDWFAIETGLDNSTLLVPLDQEKSNYVAINNARTDTSLPRFLWRLLSKKSFRTYMLANLEANEVGAMPVLYRLA